MIDRLAVSHKLIKKLHVRIVHDTSAKDLSHNCIRSENVHFMKIFHMKSYFWLTNEVSFEFWQGTNGAYIEQN